MLGVMTGIPSRGESLHVRETGDKRWPDRPSRLVADFTLPKFKSFVGVLTLAMKKVRICNETHVCLFKIMFVDTSR